MQLQKWDNHPNMIQKSIVFPTTQELSVPINTKKIKTLSLFSGAGGLDIGFSQAGFEIVGCVEIEPAYAKTLVTNAEHSNFFGSRTNVHCQDIREFDPSPYADMGIECVIGGPPCQTFSAAGRRSGGVLGTTDARGRLFESYCHVLEVINPKVFVFENVYGLPGANGGEPWRQICSAFGKLGYKLTAEVLDAADYGVPQHRERLIIVGVKDLTLNFTFPLPTHGPDSSKGPPLVTILNAIHDLQAEDEPNHSFDGLYGHLLPLVPEGLNYSFFTREMGYPQPYFAWRSKFHDFLYKAHRDAPSRTIKAQPGKFTGPFHWKNRHFTVEELKRIQSFPDSYQIVGSYSKIVEQIGNSVPPRLANVIAVSVREQLLTQKKALTYAIRPSGFVSTFRQRQRERTNHYKQMAAVEIKKRYPNLTQLDAASANRTHDFFVSFEGYFSKETLDQVKQIELGKTYFSVNERIIDKDITLSINSHSKKSQRTIKIEITGLAKYLLKTERLSCEAKITNLEDVFRVWDIIEDALTRNSQFYTLIDIYGHYANRGDTVKVSTKFSGRNRSTLDRAIEFFGDSSHCGFFMDEAKFAAAIGSKQDEVKELVRLLRGLRWDVRLPETHATIREDGILCTYPFPLLSGKAQLERKNRRNSS